MKKNAFTAVEIVFVIVLITIIGLTIYSTFNGTLSPDQTKASLIFKPSHDLYR